MDKVLCADQKVDKIRASELSEGNFSLNLPKSATHVKCAAQVTYTSLMLWETFLLRNENSIIFKNVWNMNHNPK